MLMLLIAYLNFLPIYSYYPDDIITELVPKIIHFTVLDSNSYKIFEYTPLCKGSQTFQNIYVQLSNSFDFYIYDNLSSIQQDKNFKFINYEIHEEFTPPNVSKYIEKQFTCGIKYYFVISGTYPDFRVMPSHTILRIINTSSDTINISPSISDFFYLVKENMKIKKNLHIHIMKQNMFS